MNNAEAARADGHSEGPPPLNYFNYYSEVEDTFIRRRGKHLLISPLDWALIESWKQMGIPLHVVLRGIEKAFDSYEARPRNRSVKTLFYCQEEVEAQFAEWLESQRGAPTPTPSAGVFDEGGAVEAGRGDAGERAEAEEQLRPYRARMERSTYEQTLDNLLAKALREAAGAPRLSLFYL